MKKTKNCLVEDCIPTPSSCIIWNGGDIEALGICNDDTLNNVIIEIIDKLKELAGEDISSFDLDELLAICNQKAPLETNLISILTLLRDNQVCLKDYIDTLNEKIGELGKDQGVNVNLKCFNQLDNLGNELSMTRAQLDQLVIDQLCNQRQRLTSIEGEIIAIWNAINEDGTGGTVQELQFATCIDPGVKSTSQQVNKIATSLCSLRSAVGPETAISQALSLVPSTDNTDFGLTQGWVLVPANLAQEIGNMIIKLDNLNKRVKFMEENCCAMTCDDIELGFTATFNEDGDGFLIRFTSAAGTSIPTGFEDKGSKGTITDKNGQKVNFNLSISNNSETEVLVSGLDTTADVRIDITAILGNGALTCEKCIGRNMKLSSTNCCVITNSGSEDLTIVYQTTI